MLSLQRLVSKCASIRSFAAGVTSHYVEKTPITAQLWEMRKLQLDADDKSRGKPQVHPVNDEKLLLTKTPADTKLRVKYGFNSDPKLRDLYIDPAGHIIIGKLLEDLDALAGNIATCHCDDNDASTMRLSLVTASVDKIAQKQPLPVDGDLLLSGQVVWVGRSSLVIMMTIHSANNPDLEGDVASGKNNLWTSYFTYVARNRETGKAALVNKLKLTNEYEQKLFDERQALVSSRGKSVPCNGQGISAKESTEDIHSRLVEQGAVLADMPALAHPNAVLMKYTALENSLVCQPQNVNTAGKVFGGFIMHKAYDLALATSYTFAGSYPVFLESDKISFRRPVEVGDLLRLKSRVVFTSDDPIQPRVVIEVRCQVINPEKASSFVSNVFSFTFGFRHGISLRKVLPSTFEEAGALIQGSEALNIPQLKFQ